MSRKFFVQSEHVRHEGPASFVESTTKHAAHQLRAFPGETYFTGKGAKKRAGTALAEVMKWVAAKGEA